MGASVLAHCLSRGSARAGKDDGPLFCFETSLCKHAEGRTYLLRAWALIDSFPRAHRAALMLSLSVGCRTNSPTLLYLHAHSSESTLHAVCFTYAVSTNQRGSLRVVNACDIRHKAYSMQCGFTVKVKTDIACKVHSERRERENECA